MSDTGALYGRAHQAAVSTTFGVQSTTTRLPTPTPSTVPRWPRRPASAALALLRQASASAVTTDRAFDRYVFTGHADRDPVHGLALRVQAMARADKKAATWQLMHGVYDFLERNDHASIDRLLALYERDQLPIEVSIGLLTVTLQAAPRLRHRHRVVQIISEELSAIGENPDIVLRGLR